MPEGFALLDLTPQVLLGITILLLLTGRLIPRTTLLDKAQESDRWREAYEAEREARAASDAQTKELLEVAHLTHAIINALFIETNRIQFPAGGADVAPKT